MAEASDSDNEALEYTWDFGDESFGTGANNSHTYEEY